MFKHKGNTLQVGGLNYWKFAEGLYGLDTALSACDTSTPSAATYKQIGGTGTGFLFYSPGGAWVGSNTICDKSIATLNCISSVPPLTPPAATPDRIVSGTWMEVSEDR